MLKYTNAKSMLKNAAKFKFRNKIKIKKKSLTCQEIFYVS